MERLTPRSTTTTWKRVPEGSAGATSRRSPQVTSAARSRPPIGGTRSAASRSVSTAALSVLTTARMAPRSRMWRVTARVSTPVTATTPRAESQASQPASAARL